MPTHVTDLFGQSGVEFDLSPKQQAVLTASLRLFADKGYDQTSTADIAQAAGVSAGTVFKRFKTKEGILHALLRPIQTAILPRAANEFLTKLANQPAQPFADIFAYAIADRLTYAMANRQALRVLLQEISKDPAILGELTTQLGGLIEARLAAIFAHYRATGELVAWPAMRIIRTTTGVLAGYLVPNLLLGQAPLDVAATTREVCEALLPALTPKRKLD